MSRDKKIMLFRRFKKKKETRLAVERLESGEDITISLQVIIIYSWPPNPQLLFIHISAICWPPNLKILFINISARLASKPSTIIY